MLIFLANRFLTLFTCSDSDTFFKILNKYLPVSDFAGTGTFNNAINGALYKTLINSDFQTYLLEKIDFNIISPIGLVIPLLLATSQGVGDGNFIDFTFVKFLFDIIQLFWLNIGNNNFHF